MTQLSIIKILDWLKENGYPEPTNEHIMEYVDAEKYQNQIDEAIKNNYHPADLDRWIILMDLFDMEITYNTAMTISNALDEDEINPTDVYELGPSSIEQKIYAQAVRDYDELFYIVLRFKGTLKELCTHLKGYNYDENLKQFDCNYKTITVTIRNTRGINEVYFLIDVWDDKHSTLLKEHTSIDCLRLEVSRNG